MKALIHSLDISTYNDGHDTEYTMCGRLCSRGICNILKATVKDNEITCIKCLVKLIEGAQSMAVVYQEDVRRYKRLLSKLKRSKKRPNEGDKQ